MKKLITILTAIGCSIAINLHAQAPSVDCSSSTLLTVNGSCGSGTLIANTLQAGVSSTNICGSGQNISSREGWYAFIATSANAQVTVDALDRNVAIQVFSGTCAALTEIGCANAVTVAGPQVETVNLTGLTTGVTYYVRVSNITANNLTLNSVCITSPSPPLNDNPCSAQGLSGGGACVYHTYTNAFATATVGPPAPACGGYSGGDVWFTATVPGSGNLTIDTQTGFMTDGSMAVYSGSCGALTLIACDADNSANGLMPSISLTGQTPGATIYIRIWENGNNQNGTFGICAFDPTTPTTNCSGALGVCNTAAFAGNAGGFGTQELTAANRGCLSTNEHQTTWFGFSPALPGVIQLEIAPTVGAVDYDFAIWGPYPPGSGCPVTGAPLRCSYSSITGPTGLLSGSGDLTEPAGGNSYVESITITAAQVGMIYYLVVDNYTANTTPFNLNWNLSPFNMLDCTPPLPVELGLFNGETMTSINHVYWTTLSETNCAYFMIEKSNDGINYSEMERVSGHGNSNSPIEYNVFDNSPYEMTYYRLKQFDYDGSSEVYTPIVLFNNATYGLRFDKIYPNPADESFTVEIYSKNHTAAALNMQVFDAMGRLIYQQPVTEEGQLNYQINCSSWVPGIYTVKVSSDNYHFSEVKKIIIK